jgi:uncharacterized protein
MEGTLTDAGPLVALLNRNDNHHERAASAVNSIVMPLLTTWPVVAEAMFLLGDSAGWRGQNALWTMIVSADLTILPVGPSLNIRMREMMDRYRDMPMDLADATLVAIAEQEGIKRIFSLDHHFRVYRIGRSQAFEVVP